MDFKDKVILVTGATSGIGQGIAKNLLELGAKVIVNYAHNEEKANETKDMFEKYTDNVLFIKADVSNENDVKNMFEIIDKKYGRLDGLVNNAAYDKINSIENLTPEEFRKELDVNLVGRWMCIKYCIPLMKKVKTIRM